MQRAARDGVCVRAEEYEIVRADGARVWLLMHASPLLRDGTVCGAVAVGVDITERKAAERQIEDDLDAMQQLQHLGTVLAAAGIDARTCLEQALDVAIKLTEADRGDIQVFDTISDSLVIAAHRGSASPFLDFFGRVEGHDAAACGAALASGQRVVIPDVQDSDIFAGQPSLHVLLEAGVRAIQSTPLVSTDGQVLGIVSTHFRKPWRPDQRILHLLDVLARQVADYLERAAAEARLRDSEERFRTISEALPNLVFVHDSTGHNSFVNRAFCEFSGRQADSLLEDRWLDLVHPEDANAATERWRHAVEQSEPFVCEYRLRRHDGHWRWHMVRSVPQKNGRAVQRWIGTATDITDHRNTQAALLEADRRKDEFLAVLAHELRNPLAPIRTGVELLRLRSDKPGATERVRSMLERQVVHMVRLIDDLLDVSRIASGKIQLQRQHSLLAEMVHIAVEANRPGLDAGGLNLSVVLPDTPCMLDVDPARFVQVLSNLLHNATKFTENGGDVSVTAALDESTSPPLLTLTVRDTGVGIAPSTLPRVFDLFVQGDTHGAGKAGLGIGLALARQLVEMQGGRIEAHSDGVGRGSSFTIKIPACKVLDDCAAADPLVPALDISRRVLIVDDNIDAAETLAAFVEAHGGAAAIAHDGEEGIRLA